ncbi:MAG: hypothetical protein JWO06_726 [Bacteroidota bacterium]|nr:hypothetical protein [Bacteroidota bacterium]
MLKADSNGNVIVGTALNSGGDDWIGISADPFGNAYLSSDFFANPFIVGTDTLLLTAGENDFVAKFTSGSLQCNLSVSVRRSGDTLIASNASTYQWYFNGNPIVGDTANHIVTSNAGNYTVLITDINGCTALSSPVAFTSIKPLTDDHIIIYPNPSTGKWQLTTNPEYIGAEMQIFDASGRLVFKSEIKNIQSEINLNVPNGIYFLRLGNSENTVVSKLVKL